MLLLFLAMFVTAGFIIVAVFYATNVYSSQQSALLAGLGAGAWSATVMLAMPIFGRLFDLKQYEAAFALAALVPMAGWGIWMALNRRSPDSRGSQQV
jgi:hypothetical protein